MSAYFCEAQTFDVLATSLAKAGRSVFLVGQTREAVAARYGAEVAAAFQWHAEGAHLASTRTEAALFARIFATENAHSMKARYDDRLSADEVARMVAVINRPAAEWIAHASPVAVLKAADGYAYQACESAEWRGSLASALLGMVRTEAIRALPGYDDAPWTIGPADLHRLGGPTCRTCEARTAAAATPPATPATVTRVRARRGQLRLED